MFYRMANGWALAKQSFRVLMLDKELLLFPLFSGISCLIVLASFAVPLWNSELLSVVMDEQAAPESPLAYLVLFLFYFVNYFVIVFFNSALIACAIIRFKGGDPTLADGLSASMARLPQILGWALVSATVGTILKVIESRSERAGQIASALLGMGWSAASYFVVPVLVVEKVGPVEAVKRSLSILRHAWGEALSANFGIGLITGLLSLLGIIPIILGVMMLGGSAVLGGILLAMGIGWILLLSLVSSALNSIVLGALYIYAAEGRVPDQFDGSLLGDAFGHR